MTKTKQIKLLNELIEKGDNPQRVIIEIYDYVADKDEKPREVITLQDYINGLKSKINTSDWKLLYKHITSKQVIKYTKKYEDTYSAFLKNFKEKTGKDYEQYKKENSERTLKHIMQFYGITLAHYL